MKKVLSLGMALAMFVAVSPTAFGAPSEQTIVHQDLSTRTQLVSQWAGKRGYDYYKSMSDVAVGVAQGGIGTAGQVIPGGNVLAYVTEAGEVVWERDGDPASRSIVMTTTKGVHIPHVVFTVDKLVVLEGVPDLDQPGFVEQASLHVFDSTTGGRSLTASIGPDIDGWSVGHLDADSDGDGVAFLKLRKRPEILYQVTTSTPVDVDASIFYSSLAPDSVGPDAPLAQFHPREIALDKPVSGLSLHRGRIAYNAGGSIGYVLASKIATEYSFSWGLSQQGGFGGRLGSGRVVGSPALFDDTLAYLEADDARTSGSVILVDMNSGQVSAIGVGEAALDAPSPVLNDDFVYWVRDAGEATLKPVGGTSRTFILPHVLERTGFRATDRSSSTVATLGLDPSPISVWRERGSGLATGRRSHGIYTVQSDGARWVHAIHRGEQLPVFTGARILPTANKRGVTLSVSAPGGGSLPLPVSVVSTGTTSGGGAGKASFQDFHFRTSVTPTTSPLGPIYSATFDEVGRRTLFQFRYPGDGTFGSGESVLFEFAPTPVVTAGISPSSPLRGRAFTVRGEVRTPQPDDGSVSGTATVSLQRLTRKGWDGTVKGSGKRNPLYQGNSTGGTNPIYTASNLRITEPGVYRVRVTVPANEFHEAASSPWRQFRVR
ncbi:MAG: hypothetical protein U1E26_03870 [Coriobacteriia bacterium]|nr:hypothetical protein [Coriobacteriia bacterium]